MLTSLLCARRYPSTCATPSRFCTLSGWRVGEAKSLEWCDVDLAGGVIRLRPEVSKTKDGRILPLTGELAELIERAQANRRLDCPFVFNVSGKPIKDFRDPGTQPAATRGSASYSFTTFVAPRSAT